MASAETLQARPAMHVLLWLVHLSGGGLVFADIQEFYEVTLSDESKTLEKEAEEMLAVAQRLDNQRVDSLPLLPPETTTKVRCPEIGKGKTGLSYFKIIGHS